MEVNLTEYSHGGGCGCKIAPNVLEQIIHSEITINDPRLLVGNKTNDDAAVYELDNGNCIISTTDFFMPVVNDPFDFGCIAAANSISDVYAMGGTPLLAIAILGWPINQLPAHIAKKVLDGARSICTQAGITIAGGHSIDSPEPFFGLAVNGMVDKKNLKRNNTARDGDLIFLTKPLGIGMQTTAMKRKLLRSDDQITLLATIKQLNNAGEALGKLGAVHAMTDVTGFGLLGHLYEMSNSSNLTAEITYSSLPLLPNVDYYIEHKTIPGATSRNWNSFSQYVSFADDLQKQQALNVLPDPQTNGGLLVAVAPDAAQQVIELFQNYNINCTTPIGTFTGRQDKIITIK